MLVNSIIPMDEKQLKRYIKEQVILEFKKRGVYDDTLNEGVDEGLAGRIGATALMSLLGLGGLNARNVHNNQTADNNHYVEYNTQQNNRATWAKGTSDILLDIVLNREPINNNNIEELKNTDKGKLALQCLGAMFDLARQHYNYYITHKKELGRVSCQDYIRRCLGYNEETKQAKDAEAIMFKYRMDDNEYLRPFMLANYVADSIAKTNGGGNTRQLLHQGLASISNKGANIH